MKHILKVVAGAAIRAFTNKKGKRLKKTSSGLRIKRASLMALRERDEPLTGEVMLAHAYRVAVVIGALWAAKQLGLNPADIIDYLN